MTAEMINEEPMYCVETHFTKKLCRTLPTNNEKAKLLLRIMNMGWPEFHSEIVRINPQPEVNDE